MATPVVYDGVFYVGVGDGIFYAVSESTQQILWSDSLGLRLPAPGGGCRDCGTGHLLDRHCRPQPLERR